MARMPQNTLPDYHFVLIASNLGAEWFFDAARAYWQRFTPTVISDLSLVSLIPEDYTIAVTVIARRDRVAEIGVELTRIAPEALFDPVVFDFVDEAQQALDERAQLNQPFGEPLLPTQTPTPGPTSPPSYPTPGPLAGTPLRPTPEITEVPAVPTQADTDDEDSGPSTPIFPTPGPITGS